MALPREQLQAFGGPLTIEQFREDFMTIDNIEWVLQYYMNRTLTTGVLPKFYYKEEQQRKDTKIQVPTVLVKRARTSNLFKRP